MTNTDILKNGFTTKAQYLVWRTTWKENYAALTQEIRKAKIQRKDKDALMRGGAQYTCWRLRQQATEMLEQRKQSKIEAQRQYVLMSVRVYKPTFVSQGGLGRRTATGRCPLTNQ